LYISPIAGKRKTMVFFKEAVGANILEKLSLIAASWKRDF